MVVDRHWRNIVAALFLTVAGIAAYWNSFSVPLLLDDTVTIGMNPQLQGSVSLLAALHPKEDTGVGGRPVASWTLALNAKLGGRSVTGYHVGNLAIHLAAGWVLFGLVRRTVAKTGTALLERAAPFWIGFAVALLWVVHPLQTESVTYVSQRTESLMGLFYLATLYCFVRGASGSRAWFVAAVVACASGMASKEGMVTAPLVVLIYDFVFIGRTWRSVLAQRWLAHAGLAATWLLLPLLMGGLHSRGVGFGFKLSPLTSAFIEAQAVLHYVRLAWWPANLIFDYGTDLGGINGYRVVAALVLMGALGAAIVGVSRRRAWGFLVGAFFLLLAPTSSIVPIPLQPISENRAYLASVIVITGLVAVMSSLGRRTFVALLTVATAALAFLAHQRNLVYESELSIWSDTVAKLPTSSRAHTNLGSALLHAGKAMEAKREFERVLAIKPDFADAHANLAGALGILGQDQRALEESRLAVQLDEKCSRGYYNLAVALTHLGKPAEALPPLLRAIDLQPGWADPHVWLVNVYFILNRPTEVLAAAQTALEYSPGNVETLRVRATALGQLSRVDEALAAWIELLRIAPNDAPAFLSYGTLLLQLNKPADAIEPLTTALRLAPRLATAHANLGVAYWLLGRKEDAIAHLEAAVQLDPGQTVAKDNLAKIKGQTEAPAQTR